MTLDRATRTERLELVVGARLGRTLERDMVAATSLAPTHTVARFVAAIVAVLVLAAIAGAFLAGVALIVLGAPNPYEMLVGAALAGGAALMRPRLGSSAVRSTPDPAAAPALHDLVAEVATELGVAFPDAIVLDADFNASWGMSGLRRRRVLQLGVPLLSALDGQSRAALIAHEFAHERNDDARRTVLIGTALNTLAVGATLLDHEQRGTTREASVLEPFVNMCLFLLARPVVALWWAQSRLLYRDSQRAEYLADDLAASVAGTAGVVAVHDCLLTIPAMRTAVQRMAVVSGGDPAELFGQLRAAVDVDSEARDRRRERARAEEFRIDVTHPPTASRIAVLERRALRPARVVVDPDRAARIDAELARLQPACARQLLDERRSALYAG